MKKYLYFPLFILSVLVALTGCHKDYEEPPTPPEPPVVVKGLTPLTSADAWFADAKTLQDKGYDPQVMVVRFALDNLPTEITTEDVAAAFVGDQCRYASVVQPYEAQTYGRVVMYRTNADGDSSLSFTIRYYSQKQKGYYTSAPIEFVTNGTLGTLPKLAQLTWVLEN